MKSPVWGLHHPYGNSPATGSKPFYPFFCFFRANNGFPLLSGARGVVTLQAPARPAKNSAPLLGQHVAELALRKAPPSAAEPPGAALRARRSQGASAGGGGGGWVGTQRMSLWFSPKTESDTCPNGEISPTSVRKLAKGGIASSRSMPDQNKKLRAAQIGLSFPLVWRQGEPEANLFDLELRPLDIDT